MVGDSGLGKSPLLYQLAICVAAGIPFLGRTVLKGTVLFLDFENGIAQVDEIITTQSRYLGLQGPPANLLLWNANDAPAKWDGTGYGFLELIKDFQPTLVIIDSLNVFKPEAEEKSSIAARFYKELRTLIRECRTTFLCVLHLKKDSDKPDYKRPPLEDSDVHDWFRAVRGTRALVNNSDVRLGIDRPGQITEIVGNDGSKEQVALVVRGFGRVRGEIPTTYIARVLNEDGDPIGHKRVCGLQLLLNSEQRSLYEKLPDRFRFKDVRLYYQKSDSAVTAFLKKCVGLGILKKAEGHYEKVAIPE